MGKKSQIKSQNKKNKSNSKKGFGSILKSGNKNDLEAELGRINEMNAQKPIMNKNKEKRKELVFMRNGMKNKLKGKLRRKKQEMREETGEEPVNETKTIENQREKDETFIDPENDEELQAEKDNDEYTDYFDKKYDPQVLITTSIKHTGAIFKFVKELKDTIPNSYFYYRKKYNLKDIVELAKEKGFTDIIVVYERLRKPYRMTLVHLAEGPTVEFKITNVVYHEQIEDAARATEHAPEVIFKNFNTKLGFRLSRIINGLFPSNPDLQGRQVATFHNQRDFIFFRFHRYIFNEEFNKVNLQEIGPRFCLRLLSIQKGTFDNQFAEYEWYYKNKMGVRRRKFYI